MPLSPGQPETVGHDDLLQFAVGLARSTYRRLPQAQTAADPDADMRAWRPYAAKNCRHGFRRAWAGLRYGERRAVNKKKVHCWRRPAGDVGVAEEQWTKVG